MTSSPKKKTKDIQEIFSLLNIPVPETPEEIYLFDVARTHYTALPETESIKKDFNAHYDRLEFLGDSILKFIINSFLYKKYKKYNSGQLTKLSALLLSDKTLKDIAKDLNIEDYVKINRGVKPEATHGDVIEALLGAIYLVHGFDQVEEFILRHYKKRIINANASKTKGNYKAVLQEVVQKAIKKSPEYIVLNKTGHAHDPCFEMTVKITHNNKEYILGTSAKGASKKDASQNVARKALKYLEENPEILK